MSSIDSKIENWLQQNCYNYIEPTELVNIIDNNFIYQIIDVRNTNQDYIGGNITGCHNIQYDDFKNKLSFIINQYANKDYIVIHCMYSQCRALRSMHYYKKCIEHIMTKFLNRKNKNVYEISFNNTDYKYFKDNIIIDINLINNLLKQKMFILKNGFSGWIRHHHNSIYFNKYIQNFDKKFWKIKLKNNSIKYKHRDDWMGWKKHHHKKAIKEIKKIDFINTYVNNKTISKTMPKSKSKSNSKSDSKRYNCAIILLNMNNEVLLLRHSNHWGTPGGRSKKSDDGNRIYDKYFRTMKREYEEETGTILPALFNISDFSANERTTVYIARTRNELGLPEDGSLNGDGEHEEWKLVKLNEILDKHDSGEIRLRRSVYKSFKKAFDEKYLII